MTKANITQYSATANSNTDINDINIAENCPASGLNNAIRELMAHLKNVDTGSQALTALTVTGALSAKGGAVFNEDSADVDFRVEGNGDTHALFVQGGSDHVGINNTSPNSQLTGADNLVVGNTGVATSGMTFVGSGGSGSQALIHFSDATSGTARYDGFIGYEHTDRFMKFGTAQAEQVRIHSNGVLSASDGIALGVGTANTASNVLDDYEEGSFTPAYNQASANATQLGKYTKIGNMVIVNIRYQGTHTASTTSLGKITGLPFTIHDNCSHLTINTREFSTTGKHLHANLNPSTTESFTFTDASNGSTFGAGSAIGLGFTFAYAIQGS